IPSTAATTTGMYSGLQPAITALMATFSAVIDTARCSTKAICCLGSSRAASSILATFGAVGGTTGRPSVQPCWKQNSIASSSEPSTAWRFEVSVVGMATSFGAVTLAQNRSLGDRYGHRPCVAERRHDRGMLPRTARYDDHHVVGCLRDVDPRIGRLVPEARRVDDGEALDVFGAEGGEGHAGALPERALQGALGPSRGGDGLGVLGAEDHQRLAAEIDIVAAGGGRRPDQRAEGRDDHGEMLRPGAGERGVGGERFERRGALSW